MMQMTVSGGQAFNARSAPLFLYIEVEPMMLLLLNVTADPVAVQQKLQKLRVLTLKVSHTL